MKAVLGENIQKIRNTTALLTDLSGGTGLWAAGNIQYRSQHKWYVSDPDYTCQE